MLGYLDATGLHDGYFIEKPTKFSDLNFSLLKVKLEEKSHFQTDTITMFAPFDFSTTHLMNKHFSDNTLKMTLVCPSYCDEVNSP